MFYEDEVAKVYNADFRDVIDTMKFDYIITDPPYNINFKYPDYKDCMPTEQYIDMLARLALHKTIMIHYTEEFVSPIGDALGKPSKLIPWCYNSNLGRQHRSIGWFGCKPDLTRVKQPYKNPNDKRIKKLVEKGSEGSRLYDWWGDIGLVKNVSKEKNKNFTNQIPVELLERIILTTTNEGDSICDPFFGSGSLYFACKKTNRKCIGIEQSQKHLDIFRERLLQ